MSSFLRAQLACAVAIAMVIGGCATRPEGPRNLSLLKSELRAYVASGQYDREIAAVAGEAGDWIQRRARQGGARLTVVFDLDETLLSNVSHMTGLDFGYVPAEWSRWVASANAPAIPPVRDVYNVARRMRVDVVFITGRTASERAATEQNLRAIGCADYEALICRPEGDRRTAAAFKTSERARLSAEGRTLIANLGDQTSDLAGGYAERTFKLPNPFYLTE